MVKRVPNDHPVELTAPDISAHAAGNTGVPYYTSLAAAKPGPHVLINALTHGNELCGAIALDHLLRHEVQPLRGRLTLGFANVAAYQAFDAADPTATRFLDEDFNRVWDEATLGGARQSRELERARQIRPLIDTVDLLLDIHSMQERTVPLMLAGPLAKGLDLARAFGAPEVVVVDEGHAAGRRLRDYGGFGDPASAKNALLIECGQHWEQASATVAIDAAWRFLMTAGLVDEETAAPHLAPTPRRQTVIAVTGPVTIRTDAFRFARPFVGLEVLGKGEVIGWDGEEEITAPFDGCVLIMPSRRLWKGYTAVRLGRYL